MKPCTDAFQRIKLRVILEDDSATSKPARLFHDRTPITQQPLQISTTRTMTTGNRGQPLLREVEKDVLWTLYIVVINAHV
jgi:hypothetical protein